MTTGEVAKMLGIAESSVRRLRLAGVIPAKGSGRAFYYEEADIIKLKEARKERKASTVRAKRLVAKQGVK